MTHVAAWPPAPYLDDMTHVNAWPPAPYLEDMTHVAKCLPGLLLHSPWHDLHGLWDEPNLTRHVQGVVHLRNKC